jgi:hypothetical protein
MRLKIDFPNGQTHYRPIISCDVFLTTGRVLQ